MGFLELILSSAVVVALFDWFRGNKSNRLQYITNERRKWRENIKKIAMELEKSDNTDIHCPLVALKTNLNSYGYHKTGEYPPVELLDFSKDEHIWKEIDELERAIVESEAKKIEEHKKMLIYYISLLLKFDWERSKEEISIPIQIPISIVAFGLSVLLMLLSIYSLEEIKANMYECFRFIFGALTLYGLCWIPYIVEKPRALRTQKWYKSITSILLSSILILEYIIMWSLIGNGRGIEASVSKSFFFVSVAIIMIYPIIRNHIYKEYDDKITEILCTNKLTVYATKYMISSIRIRVFMNRYNLKIEYMGKDKYSEIHKVLDSVFVTDIVEGKQALKILKRRYYLGYILRKSMSKKRIRDKGDYLKEYIKEKPQRCRPIVKYRKEEKDYYGIGLDKGQWENWIGLNN